MSVYGMPAEAATNSSLAANSTRGCDSEGEPQSQLHHRQSDPLLPSSRPGIHLPYALCRRQTAQGLQDQELRSTSEPRSVHLLCHDQGLRQRLLLDAERSLREDAKLTKFVMYDTEEEQLEFCFCDGCSVQAVASIHVVSCVLIVELGSPDLADRYRSNLHG